MGALPTSKYRVSCNRGIKNQEIAGCNVTIPFKNIVIPFTDNLTLEAKQTQSVNTIVFDNGKLVGHNTDIAGFYKAIKSLNFEKIGILRPSFLLGNRKEKRVGEKIGIFIFKLLSPLFFGPIKKMKPIHSEKVAKAMIKIANENLRKTILESDEIVEISSG